MLEPGFYYDKPFQTYLDLRIPNAGAIKDGMISMKRMRANVLRQLEDTDSTARKFGRAAHCFILEGEEAFRERIKIKSSCCGIKKNGDSCENGGKFVDDKGNWYCGVHADEYCFEDPDAITEDEVARIQMQAEAIRSHKCFKVLKAGGLPEVTAVGDVFGVRCKVRLDFWREGEELVIDLKKQDRNPLSWDVACKTIAQYDYCVQAELYRLVVESITGKKPTFIWLFAESNAPFDVLPMQLSERDAASARAWIEMILTDYRKCEIAGDFPGVWDKGHPAKSSLPDWKMNQTPNLEGMGYDNPSGDLEGQQQFEYASEDDGYPL
jgi:hypothetical protein